MSLASIYHILSHSSDADGQLATSTYDYKKIHRGQIYCYSEYDTDTDISGPKQISIQTGDNPIAITLELSWSAAVTVAIGEEMVIGTGGSPSAGTTVTGYNRNRSRKYSGKSIQGLVVKKDFVYGSSNNTAGTILKTEYMPGASQGALRVGSVGRSSTSWILRENCMYSLVITAISDNTVISWSMDIHEEE